MLGSLINTSRIHISKSLFSLRALSVCNIVASNKPFCSKGAINLSICLVKRIGTSSGTVKLIAACPKAIPKSIGIDFPVIVSIIQLPKCRSPMPNMY